ncbi:MAG: hypothetical protein EZS28_019755 [Streblomastix strix]|uniref:Uncharacterized protein n=1 Tax=Streblomastix strix TaxID=222440 RepID=A0A5J4VPY6_9EUKA|nr:MAG: hypothetical protein EZS28_019755 [Streblomastix strix]
MKSVVCYLPQKNALDSIDINLTHCSYNALDHVILVIGIIGLLYLCIYGYFMNFFSFQAEMYDPSITDCRNGIFPAFSHVIVAITIAVQTFLVEYSPIISAIVQIVIFALLGIYVILCSPYMKLQSNQIHSAMYIGASAGGPISLILSGLNILAQHGNNNIDNYQKVRGIIELIFAIILFYSILIITFVIFFWGATVLAQKSAISKWIIKPVYEWRDVSEEEESVIRESYFQGVKKVVNAQSKGGIKQFAIMKRSLLQKGINTNSNTSINQSSSNISQTSSNTSIQQTSSITSLNSLSDSEQQIDPLQHELLNKKWKLSFEKTSKKRHIRKFMVGVILQVEKDKDPIIYSVEPTLMQKISGNAPLPKRSSLYNAGKKGSTTNLALKVKQANLLALAVSKSKLATVSPNIPSSLSIQENSSVDKSTQQPKQAVTPKIKAKSTLTNPKTTQLSNSAVKGSQPKPKTAAQPKKATNAASHQCKIKRKIPIIDRKYEGVISCSHPKLQWTSTSLLAAPDTAQSILKQYDSPSKLEQGIRFMQIPELNSHKLTIPFSFVLINNALKKDIFKLSAEHHVTFALFLNAFRPDQVKTALFLQKAASLFPGWSNRWIIFKMMREFESNNLSESKQTSGQKKDGVQPQSSDKRNTSFAQRNMMTQASKSFLLARAHTLHTYPDSPNILRQFSALVRDIHGDKKLAEDILAEADQIEEEKAKIAARLLKQRMNKLKQNKQLIGVNNEDMSKAGATHAALAANIFIQKSTSNQRNALLLSEKMSSAVGYSIYTMFRVLSKDESEDMDEGDSYSIIYQSGFDTVNKTLFEINELFPSVYNYDFNNKIWIDNIVEWNILTFTFPDSAVGSLNPVFTINTSVVENMNIPRFVSWIEDSIMRMSDDFSNFSQVEQQEAVRTPFTTMKEHFAELLFNQPFVAAETLKRICVIALEDLFSMQVEGYIITIIIFVVCLIVLVSGVALPLLFTIRLTKNNRIEAVKDLCAVTSDQAQSVVAF